jgi:hypothetical protein
VIAVEGGSDLSLLLNPEMTIDSAGQWRVLYQRRPSISFRIAGLMPPEELESYLNPLQQMPRQGSTHYERAPCFRRSKLDVAAATGWSEPFSGAGVQPAKLQRLSRRTFSPTIRQEPKVSRCWI